MKFSRFREAALLACAALLLLWNLNYAPLWNPDEGRYGSSALEMAQPFGGSASDWIVPHLNTVARLNKPPLVYWSAALCAKLFGLNEFSVRLPSALAAIGVLLILWRLGGAMFDRRTGLIAALVWTTSLLPFALGRVLNTDMLLTFSVALALWGLWKIAEKKRGGILIAGIGFGLALLTKGPVGLVLPILIWGARQIFARGKNAFNARSVGGVLGACGVALLIALPWYLAVARQHPEFLKGFLVGENWDRLTGKQIYHKPEPFYFYLPITLIGMFPWTFWLLPAAGDLWTQRKTPGIFIGEKLADQNTSRSNLIFLWLWAAAVVTLFSISHVKLITYVLPAFPALAILVAASITAPAREGENANASTCGNKLWRACAWSSSALFLIFALVLLGVDVFSPHVLGAVMPRDQATPLLLPACGVLFIGAFAIAWTTRATGIRTTRIAILQAATMAIFCLFIVPFAGRVALYEDPSAMLRALQPYLRPGDELIEFKGFMPTAIFYLQRPVVVVDVENRSGLAEEQFAASPLFPKDHAAITRALQRAYKSGQRVFVLVKWKHRHWPELRNTFLVGRSNDYYLVSNRPAPAGFAYDFVAPEQRRRRLSPECQALSPQC